MPRRPAYDRHYAECSTACGDPFPEMVRFAAGLSAPLRVLDLGCGQGRDALLFARAGHAVVGIDVSSVGIGQLRDVAAREGLDIDARVADVAAGDWGGPFDVVLLDRVLHMLATEEARAGVLARARDAVAPGGYVVVSEYPKQHALVRTAFESADVWSVDEPKRGFFVAHRA